MDIEKYREETKNLLKIADDFYKQIENHIKNNDSGDQNDLDYVKTRIDEIKSKISRLYRFNILIETRPVESWELKIDDNLIFNGKGKFNY